MSCFRGKSVTYGLGVWGLVCGIGIGVIVVCGCGSFGIETDWFAILCSISCSCCKALTNAVLSRFVCSAFNAFFTFDVTQFSHKTLADEFAVTKGN